MSDALVMEVSRDLFQTAMMVALPALAVSLIVGLVVSIFQAITSIQDQTLGHVPRILLVGLVLVLTLGFTLQVAVAFTQRMFLHAAKVGT
jgi:flagellar biosynthetic protein FliQ